MILRAPELDPELLDEPEDLPELLDLPELPEPEDFPTLGELEPLPCEPPPLLTEVAPEPKPLGRLRESRPTPLSGTRLPEPPSFRSMTRLPLSCWTEILVPDGRTFGACAE